MIEMGKQIKKLLKHFFLNENIDEKPIEEKEEVEVGPIQSRS